MSVPQSDWDLIARYTEEEENERGDEDYREDERRAINRERYRE